KKAHAIAKVKYPDIEEFGAEYRELVGYARREVYKNLKKHFNVNSYTRIRHLDAEKAIAFVESIVLGKSFLKNYEQWRMQRIKKRQREQEILKNEKGLNYSISIGREINGATRENIIKFRSGGNGR